MHLEGLKGSGRGLLDELLLLWNLTVATGILGRCRESTNLKGQNKTGCALTANCRLPRNGRFVQDTRFITIYLRFFLFRLQMPHSIPGGWGNWHDDE